MIRWNSKTIGKSHLPVMIFLHGFLGSLADWLPICRRFSTTHQCLILDLPGHGKTEASRASDYSISSTAKSLIKFLEGREIKQSVLLGYSMGGRLALYLAHHYSYFFKKVILESTSPGLRKKQDRIIRQKRDENLAADMERMNTEEFLQKWYLQPLFNTLRNHPKFNELLQQRIINQSILWPASLRGMGVGRQPSLWGKLKYLTMPILILAGEKDQKFRYIAFQMKDLNPEFSISVVPHCGHVIHVEDEDRFYQEVNKFLTDKGENNE